MRSEGLALPSLGSQTAPARSSVRIAGQSSPASLAEMTSASTPKDRAEATLRRSRVMRSGVRATATEPVRFQPVAKPVSCSSEAYNSVEYRISRVMFSLLRNCPTRPAACQAVPHESFPCSSSTTSVCPSRARW